MRLLILFFWPPNAVIMILFEFSGPPFAFFDERYSFWKRCLAEIAFWECQEHASEPHSRLVDLAEGLAHFLKITILRAVFLLLLWEFIYIADPPTTILDRRRPINMYLIIVRQYVGI